MSSVDVIPRPKRCGTVSASRKVADKAVGTASLPDFMSGQGEV
jgi:hypothetical protein